MKYSTQVRQFFCCSMIRLTNSKYYFFLCSEVTLSNKAWHGDNGWFADIAQFVPIGIALLDLFQICYFGIMVTSSRLVFKDPHIPANTYYLFHQVMQLWVSCECVMYTHVLCTFEQQWWKPVSLLLSNHVNNPDLKDMTGCWYLADHIYKS